MLYTAASTLLTHLLGWRAPPRAVCPRQLLPAPYLEDPETPPAPPSRSSSLKSALKGATSPCAGPAGTPPKRVSFRTPRPSVRTLVWRPDRATHARWVRAKGTPARPELATTQPLFVFMDFRDPWELDDAPQEHGHQCPRHGAAPPHRAAAWSIAGLLRAVVPVNRVRNV